MTKPDYTCLIEYTTFTGDTLSEALRKLLNYVEDNEPCLMHEERSVIEIVTPDETSDGSYRISCMTRAIHN